MGGGGYILEAGDTSVVNVAIVILASRSVFIVKEELRNKLAGKIPSGLEQIITLQSQMVRLYTNNYSTIPGGHVVYN